MVKVLKLFLVGFLSGCFIGMVFSVGSDDLLMVSDVLGGNIVLFCWSLMFSLGILVVKVFVE